jgi:8-oxo-dGTP diphosphatase
VGAAVSLPRANRTAGGKPVVNAEGYELLDFLCPREEALSDGSLDLPISSAFVVVKVGASFLLVYNRQKQQWEIPGGLVEPGESPRECALRELREEANQRPGHLQFEGVMLLRRPDGRLVYSALYSCSVDDPAPFLPNEETEQMLLWDAASEIGYVEEISLAMIEECRDR